MSEQNTTETKTVVETRKTRGSVKLADVRAAAASLGLEPREMKAYVHFGHKGGVSVAVAQTEDVSRVFIYRLHLQHEAVQNFSEEERKNLRLGGVWAEVDFEKGSDLAMEAIGIALQEAANAPAPVKAEPKPKTERKPRAKKTEAAPAEATDAAADAAPAA